MRRISQLQSMEKTDIEHQTDHPLIFNELKRSHLPDPEKETNRILQECRSIIAAGTLLLVLADF